MSEPNPPETTPEPQRPSSSRSLLYGCLSVLLALPFGILYILLTAGLGFVAGPISCRGGRCRVVPATTEEQATDRRRAGCRRRDRVRVAGHVSPHHREIVII